jgi:hypothetical protein
MGIHLNDSCIAHLSYYLLCSPWLPNHPTPLFFFSLHSHFPFPSIAPLQAPLLLSPLGSVPLPLPLDCASPSRSNAGPASEEEGRGESETSTNNNIETETERRTATAHSTNPTAEAKGVLSKGELLTLWSGAQWLLRMTYTAALF